MSFGEQDDEFFTIKLKELLHNKARILAHPFVSDIVPILTNYELKVGWVFKLAVVPIAFDVSIGDMYPEGMNVNEYQLRDHLDIQLKNISGDEELAFASKDYKRVRNAIDKK